MSEGTKRSLRERRAPKSFGSDDEYPDPYGYKRYPYTKDLRTPSQLINQEARLFIKFINSVNRSKIISKQGSKDIKLSEQSKEITESKDLQLSRHSKIFNNESSYQINKKPTTDLNQLKPEPFKKPKENNTLKGVSTNNSDNKQSKKNEAFFDQIKNATRQSANSVRLLQMNMVKNRPENYVNMDQQLPQNFSQPRKLDSAARNSSMANTSSGKRQGAGQTKKELILAKYKERAGQLTKLQQKQKLQKVGESPKFTFKRSSYHVAIAYHIYISKLKEKGMLPTDAFNDKSDPTYHARKLRADMERND